MDTTRPGEEPNIAMFPFFSLPRPMRDAPGVAQFTELSDRLVRHLFDIGLQLHSLRAVFDRNNSSPDDIRAAGEAITGLIDDLDILIRDAGLAMLTIDRSGADSPASLTPPTRIRRRR